MKFIPLGKRIAVRPLEKEYKGPIAMPDNINKQKPTRGEVVAVGKEVDGISVKDVVHYTKYAAIEIDDATYCSDIRIAHGKLVVLKLDDVLGVEQ